MYICCVLYTLRTWYCCMALSYFDISHQYHDCALTQPLQPFKKVSVLTGWIPCSVLQPGMNEMPNNIPRVYLQQYRHVQSNHEMHQGLLQMHIHVQVTEDLNWYCMPLPVKIFCHLHMDSIPFP